MPIYNLFKMAATAYKPAQMAVRFKLVKLKLVVVALDAFPEHPCRRLCRVPTTPSF